MPLNLTRYTVALAHDGLDLEKALEAGEGDGYDVHTVTVLHADQLVAEQAAPRYGVGGLYGDDPRKMTWATLWVWCALTRQRVEVPPFPVFKARVLELEPIKGTEPGEPGDVDDVEARVLDPTDPAPDTPWP